MAMEPHALEKEEREHALARLGNYLRSERDEEWGDLAVRLLFDVFEEQVGPLYYNRGISAAQRSARDMSEMYDVNLEALKRVPPATGR